MASSSVSQEDLENDFELSSRRTRIRTARARTVNPPTRIDPGGGDDGGGDMKTSESLNIGCSFPTGTEHDASPKPLSRAKEKRTTRCVTVRQPLTEHVNRAYFLPTVTHAAETGTLNVKETVKGEAMGIKFVRSMLTVTRRNRMRNDVNLGRVGVHGIVYKARMRWYEQVMRMEKESMPKRMKEMKANHLNKGKQQQRDRRKLREKRRSTGVVHLPSTESTGGSTGEDEDETQNMTAETRRNTQHNEHMDRADPTELLVCKVNARDEEGEAIGMNPSDLEADDEDNQEFDSLNQSDSTVSSLVHLVEATTRPRPGTPTGDNPDELLERAQEENRRLLSLLEDRDHKIATLEARVAQLQKELAQEKERLREENTALIRAMAALATAK
uniref:Uncharacterized protein n=1 Tax=Timema douglasi TaxID=61478 RepID=A0A7R8VA80_TIMDO|nr:unnamed protein product [Timema douglasi]